MRVRCVCLSLSLSLSLSVCAYTYLYIHIYTYMYAYVGERRVLSLEYFDSPIAGSAEHGRSPPPLHELDDLVKSSERFAPLRSTRHSPMLEEEEDGRRSGGGGGLLTATMLEEEEDGSHSEGGGGLMIAGLFKASSVEGEGGDLLGGLGAPDAGFAGGGFVQVPADEVGLGSVGLG
jgi:hypothetical protein